MSLKVDGKYELGEELGRGAFSIVKKCIHIQTRKEFAAKIFDIGRLSTKEHQKIEREARICRKLKHENIVNFHEQFTTGAYHYMVFEIITGGELFDDIVAREFYSEQDASLIMCQILSALQYCHKNGIVHRDIKPENLLLSSKSADRIIKLADFGLAMDCEGDSVSWYGFAGTPGYLAPEVVRKLPYGKKVDVWACGVILYILLVGYCPFWDDNNHKLYQQIKSYPVSFEGSEWDSVSSEVKQLINKMLDKQPETRMNVDQALEFAWIKDRMKVAKSDNMTETQASIRKLNIRRKLKGAILSTILTAKLGPKKIVKVVEDESKDALKTAKTKDKFEIEGVKNEILNATECYVNACTSANSVHHQDICHPKMTGFYPNVPGCVLVGPQIHNFYFESQKVSLSKSTLLNPRVTVIGSNNAAVICYTRLHFYMGNTGVIQTLTTDETIVWNKLDEKWTVVHFHRSCGNGAGSNILPVI